MTWLTLCVMPLVLAYQAWTFWVFRKRIRRSQITGDVQDDHADHAIEIDRGRTPLIEDAPLAEPSGASARA